VTCYDHTEVLTWRHLNVFQHRCEITCRLPRGKCRQCGHLFRVRPPWEGLSTHFTKEFEAFALLLMREMPMSKVAEMVGETDSVAKPQPTNPSTVRVFVTILILVQNSNLLLPAKHLRL
jgi:transposase